MTEVERAKVIANLTEAASKLCEFEGTQEVVDALFRRIEQLAEVANER